MDDQRLIDIETKLAYQEDLIQGLNKTVHSQQLIINKLEESIRSLTLRYNNLAEHNSSDYLIDEKPPHY